MSLRGEFSDIMGSGTNPAGSPSAPSHGITGTVMKAWIVTENWDADGDSHQLFCGTFEVDNSRMRLRPPATVEIKAVSVPVASTARVERKNDIWENRTRKEIAADVAARNDLGIMWDCDSEFNIDRIDQRNETDLEFLDRLAKDSGLCMKVTADRVVMYEERKYEEHDPVAIYSWGDNRVIDGEIEQSSAGLAQSAMVSYADPDTGNQFQGEFTPPNAPKVGATMQLNERPAELPTAGSTGNLVDDFSDIKGSPAATQKATAKLREANRNEWTCSMTVIGNVGIVSGATVDLIFNSAGDGRYLVDSATHDLSASGYTTRFTGHRALGY